MSAFYIRIFTVVIFIYGGNVSSEYTIPIHGNNGEEGSGTTEDVRLVDFFWTGSGDGPPDYLKKIHTGIMKGKDVVVKTETVISTVYVEGENDVDTLCLDCIDDVRNIPDNVTKTDRRYWLLTILSGYLRSHDYTFLEESLAKLYGAAFSRQQSRHLGLVNNNSDNYYLLETENSSQLNENQNGKSTNMKKDSTHTTENDNMTSVETAKRPDESPYGFNSVSPSSSNPKLLPITINRYQIPNRTTLRKRSVFNKTMPNEDQENEKYISNHPYFPVQDYVRVILHNVTFLSEKDEQDWYDKSLYSSGKINGTRNHTELIYSVFVNGKPVLARVAAEDMKLVTENEMESIMKQKILMKAEPYQKEPQATPLVPAIKSKDKQFFMAVFQDKILLGLSIAVILALILFLLALIFAIRKNRPIFVVKKRLSDEQRINTEREVLQKRISQKNDGGGDDSSGKFKTYHKNIIQELRPGSSEASTSDSSVYCPVNQPTFDEGSQKVLHHHEAISRENKSRLSHTDINRSRELLCSSNEHQKRTKKTKSKHKKRYLSENRVGSIEERVAVSSDTSVSESSIDDKFQPYYDRVVPLEAINTATKYYREQDTTQNQFSPNTRKPKHKHYHYRYSKPEYAKPINQDTVTKSIHFDEKSSGSGSIGSYLSMMSVRSFPQSTLPEPLHRVLDPVSVTYYDEHINTEISRRENLDRISEKCGEGISTISTQTISQSEIQDPGIVGPVVWEIHKKHSALADKNDDNYDSNPSKDPVSSRKRYEGLLEGAMQLYSQPYNTNSPEQVFTNTTQDIIIHPKDTRVGSAVIVSQLPRADASVRPFTAGVSNMQRNNSAMKLPLAHSNAWGSEPSYSTERPVSADPFQYSARSTVNTNQMLRLSASNISPAPLIDAVQNELKKFKERTHQ